MKHPTLITLLLCMLLTSCGGDDEPKGNVTLEIGESFLPSSIIIDHTDEYMIEECKKFNHQDFVVQSKTDLPNDPFGSYDTFKRIDFDHNSLLISYNVHSYNLVSCTYSLVRNYTENTFDWSIYMGVSGKEVDPLEQLIFTRFAILVPKLQKNVDLHVYYGINSYNSDWEW